MAASPYDGALRAGLFGDAEVAAALGDAATLAAMLRFEGALAAVQGRLGLIPMAAAEVIAEASGGVVLDPAQIAPGVAQNAITAPSLVAAFREHLTTDVAPYVHWGATSQDVADTALVLQLRPVLALLEGRIGAVLRALANQAEAHRATVMAARTWSRMATPTTLGAKIAVWGAPLLRQRQRLAELRPRLLVLSLAGASGTNAAMGPKARQVAEGLAAELDLGLAPLPWHASRDTMAELGGWLALTTGSLGKMAGDITALGQTEVAEVTVAAAGSSSTMPHKANPVLAETVVALARQNASLVGALHQAMLHGQERDGAAWMQEWLTLPPMLIAAGAALRHAVALAETLAAAPERMRANIAATQDLMLAEAATFALAAHMPRPEAQALVKTACQRVGTEGRPLRTLLAEETTMPIDWDQVFDPAGYIGEAPAIADAFVREVRETLP
ncbi:MAG: adenylosuccinate lyase family protein [Pseudomonadota bacterium]